MTDKYSGQIVFAQMKTREIGNWSEITTDHHVIKIHKKQQLRNATLSAAAVFCLGIGLSVLTLNDKKAEQVMKHVTTDFEYDETLGRLQFVSSILPESAMVFLESGDSDALAVFLPSQAGIEHAWTSQEPWVEFASDGPVFACSEGEVMSIVKSRDGEYTIRLMHENGYESLYSGLAELNVNQMDHVSTGEQIGNSEYTVGFEMRKDGVSIKPEFEGMVIK